MGPTLAKACRTPLISSPMGTNPTVVPSGSSTSTQEAAICMRHTGSILRTWSSFGGALLSYIANSPPDCHVSSGRRRSCNLTNYPLFRPPQITANLTPKRGQATSTYLPTYLPTNLPTSTRPPSHSKGSPASSKMSKPPKKATGPPKTYVSSGQVLSSYLFLSLSSTVFPTSNYSNIVLLHSPPLGARLRSSATTTYNFFGLYFTTLFTVSLPLFSFLFFSFPSVPLLVLPPVL
jgi:hypothetical protein